MSEGTPEAATDLAGIQAMRDLILDSDIMAVARLREDPTLDAMYEAVERVAVRTRPFPGAPKVFTASTPTHAVDSMIERIYCHDVGGPMLSEAGRPYFMPISNGRGFVPRA